jgi:hypothetical protein
MAKSKAAITFAFGTRDRVDPKLAPFGALKVGKNLRVRKDGRLGTRNGYAELSNATLNGTLVANDLHEYRGRLLAFGSDDDDSYPTDIFEYVGLANQAWRGTDPFGQRVTLNPFTNAREVAGVLQVEGGVDSLDSVASSGYVLLVYRDFTSAYAIIVDAETDQVVHQETLTRTGGVFESGLNSPHRVVVAAVGTSFYVAAVRITNNVVIARFRVGVDSSFSSFATPKSTSESIAPSGLDMVAVTNATTAHLAIAYDTTAGLDLKVYGSTGTQVGSTIAVAGTATQHISLEADQADNTINLYTVETATSGRLRTFNFAGTLLDGPTTVTSGATGSITRLRAQGAITEHVAVAVNKDDPDDTDVVIQVIDQDAHTVTQTITLQHLVIRSRLLSAQSAGQDVALAFSGLVAPVLPSFDQATNALFFVMPDVAHMTTRDFVRGKDTSFVGLSRDSTTGQIAWVAARDPGVLSEGVPVVTLLDFKSTARRQTASYGGLLYIAGATPSVYDGRIVGELGFQEAPGIVSLTPSAGGSLTPGATYYYTVHWEIVLADGSLMVSPVSIGGNAGESATQATSVTLGPSDNEVAVRVSTPHSVRVALGDALLGASVVAVVSRTEWILTSTVAGLFGTRDFSSTPAVAGDFNGKTLQLSVDGGATQTVTFGATDEALSELVSKINAQTTGLTASAVGSVVYLVSDTASSTASITVVGGTTTAVGAAFIGFLPGDTAAAETTGVPGSVLRRCVTRGVRSGMSHYGEILLLSDEVSDATLGEQEPLYTQGDRGALSGPLEQNAPRSCAYITATESRLLIGGLTRAHEVQISRSAFPSEVFSFSEFSPFFATASGAVVGVQSLDTAKIIFTEETVLALGGDGPDDVGGGALDPPVEIPTPSGLSTAWSLLKAPDGLWFQLDDTKLFRMPRGGGSPEWVGVDVEDTLRAFPVIVGASKQKRDNVAVFACNDESGTSTRFVVRDFRTENWLIDTPRLSVDQFSATPPVAAITSYGDTLAYASGGVVYVQTASFADVYTDSDPTTAFIETQLRTHPLYPFGINGYGNIYELLLTGEYRGDCNLALRVSYDDGATFTTLTDFDLVGLTVGSTVQRKWTLPQDITSSVVLEFTVTASDDVLAAATSESFVFNQVDLLVEAEDGLRELTADEMA